VTFDEALHEGVRLFNQQEFYEAHEVWEEAWVDELSDDRLLLQGLIQVAAGFYKLQTGAPVGTVKLLKVGAEKLRRFLARPLGVDLEALLPEVDRWQAEAVKLVETKRADYDPALLPKIVMK
jgi:predicted metal-dependent hydrolase